MNNPYVQLHAVPDGIEDGEVFYPTLFAVLDAYGFDPIDEQLPKPLASLTIQEVEDWINAAIFADQQTSGEENWRNLSLFGDLERCKEWLEKWLEYKQFHPHPNI